MKYSTVVEDKIESGIKIKHKSKLVRDNTQYATLDTGLSKFEVVSRIGRKKVFSYTFEVSELMESRETFNDVYNVNRFIRNKIISLGLDSLIQGGSNTCFFDRIVDAETDCIIACMKESGMFNEMRWGNEQKRDYQKTQGATHDSQRWEKVLYKCERR